MKFPRYYVYHSINSWMVLDRSKYKLQNDVVATFGTRREARRKTWELNNEEHNNPRLFKNDAQAGA